jgi:hypothetical protein
MEEKRLTYVTVGGHGYGAKVASVFAGLNYDRVTGVMCLDGGPIDHSYHEAWTDVKTAIVNCSKINMDVASQSDVYRVIDNSIKNPRWRKIFKENVIDGRASLQWKFNMVDLATNVKKNHRCDITKMSTTFGLYPGRTFVNFPDFSDWVFLNTNTIPFYTFFPKLEGQFPSTCFNYVQTDEHTDSIFYYLKIDHWVHEGEEQGPTIMGRMARWLKNSDGVNTLLADRTELGKSHSHNLILIRLVCYS